MSVWRTGAPRVHETRQQARAPLAEPLARFNSYYWSTYQSEWATDLLFREGEALRQLYPRLLHHAVTTSGTSGSTDIMRFLGRACP